MDQDYLGRSSADLMASAEEADDLIIPNAGYEAPRAAIESTGYPMDRVHFVKGMVEDTIPDAAPETVALLRLDTDWYESTRHEMDHLYPRLVRRGVLIVDDYGHFEGAKKAVDEYIATHGPRPFLHKVDYSGRLVNKP